MREGKKSEGFAFKAPPPPDRIGLNQDNNTLINFGSHDNYIKFCIHLYFPL